ncbi:YaiO family outer membrane beta-barrel protein [Flavobacterium antarcticum]|uniref:YaiO family outer membrane beta-barrel protein n=1 Tax=Flavobacterium antarcticum TaxID=271155 RepID=UPI0003B35820|nr:YaiO family outer membrane beta-barrel protein [Flavobacterium antarcticum]
MILKINIKLVVILALLGAFQMKAQDSAYNGDPDVSFETARKLAFNEQRTQAQDTLRNILTKYPDYHEIRSFLATTYSWDGDYKRARKEFTTIFEKNSDSKETWIAAIKNELWADLPYAALRMTSKALAIFPEDPEILFLKASAEENSSDPQEALNTIQMIIDKNPEDLKARDYKKSLESVLRKNTVGISASIDLYSSVFDPMQYYTLKYSRQTKYGSITPKVNLNRRFNEVGAQFEVDMYPKIWKGLYAYVNFGVSNSFLFPDYRYGAELYQSLPKSFEISAGFRTLKYSSTTNIYTGSVGWYYGNSYWSLRPYFTPSETGTSGSATLTYRKYRSDADNYFGISFGMGLSPEFNQYAFNANDDPVVNLESQKLNVSYNFTTGNKRNAWGVQAGISHQEIIFDQGNFFWIYSLAVSWDMKFR